MTETPVQYQALLMLGNLTPVIPADDGVGGREEPELVDGQRITVLAFPHGDFMAMLTEVQTIVGPISDDAEPGPGVMFAGSSAPVWVESTDEDLARIVARHYGCPIGRPADWPTQWPHPTLAQHAATYGLEG